MEKVTGFKQICTRLDCTNEAKAGWGSCEPCLDAQRADAWPVDPGAQVTGPRDAARYGGMEFERLSLDQAQVAGLGLLARSMERIATMLEVSQEREELRAEQFKAKREAKAAERAEARANEAEPTTQGQKMDSMPPNAQTGYHGGCGDGCVRRAGHPGNHCALPSLAYTLDVATYGVAE